MRENSPSPTMAAPGGMFFGDGFNTSSLKVGMEKLKYTQFGGKLADYLLWKYDWNQLVHLRLDEPTEMLKLRDSGP